MEIYVGFRFINNGSVDKLAKGMEMVVIDTTVDGDGTILIPGEVSPHVGFYTSDIVVRSPLTLQYFPVSCSMREIGQILEPFSTSDVKNGLVRGYQNFSRKIEIPSNVLDSITSAVNSPRRNLL